jgi:hypothetical protein
VIMMDIKTKLHEVFEYKDGNLYWRLTKSPRAVKGSMAGSMQPNGYWRVGVDRVYYGLHRAIWIYHNGNIPDGMHIDHIDRNPSNNCVENLRCCTPQQNEWNKPHCGVRFESGKWRAKYSHNNQDKHIGMFDTEDEAKAAYFNTISQVRNEYMRGAV